MGVHAGNACRDLEGIARVYSLLKYVSCRVRRQFLRLNLHGGGVDALQRVAGGVEVQVGEVFAVRVQVLLVRCNGGADALVSGCLIDEFHGAVVLHRVYVCQ